jgi:hypothetical protein
MFIASYLWWWSSHRILLHLLKSNDYKVLCSSLWVSVCNEKLLGIYNDSMDILIAAVVVVIIFAVFAPHRSAKKKEGGDFKGGKGQKGDFPPRGGK